jgi:uncharacterized UBP type Zn finger protein
MNSIELFKMADNDDTSTNIEQSVSSDDEEEEVMGTSGLINQGNTCYMNSIIQCLSNCEDFRNLIIGKDLIPNLIDPSSNMFLEKSKLESTLSFQLRKIFINIWNSSFYSFRPISFRKLFGKKIEQFQNSNQQDSQEALLCILDTINDELARDVQITPTAKSMIYDCLDNMHKNEDENYSNILKIIKTNLSEYLNYKSINDYMISHKKYSPINAIFEGRTISQLECSETKGIKTNFESFFYFSLALPQEKYEELILSESSSTSRTTSKSKSSKTSDKSNNAFWCKVCKKDLQSSKCYDEHILGRKHQNKVKFQMQISSSPGSEDIYEYQSDEHDKQSSESKSSSNKTQNSDEIDDDEFKCNKCDTVQGFNNCQRCDAENVCEECHGQGGDYGPNEIWVCHDCLPTCLECKTKLYSACDECCGKGRSDLNDDSSS